MNRGTTKIMKEKRTFYCELAYILGMIILAIGTSMLEKANFGLSMVIAPAYLIHLKVSELLPFFSFGMSGYVFQAFLLIALSLITRKVKKSYFLSFGTAVIYGIILDLTLGIFTLVPALGIVERIIFYLAGVVISAIGLAFLFQTYFPPEAYELFVKTISQKYRLSLGTVKTTYDCCSCILAILLSLIFFGGFVGVNWGTVVCAMLNGFFIGQFGKFLNRRLTFKDALPLREKLN